MFAKAMNERLSLRFSCRIGVDVCDLSLDSPCAIPVSLAMANQTKSGDRRSLLYDCHELILARPPGWATQRDNSASAHGRNSNRWLFMSQHPLIASLRGGDTGKLMSARQAVQLIRDGDTVATGGFVGIGFAENIAVALESRFLEMRESDPRRHGTTA